MKQVSVIISTYTADVSGVCSALYELGGMVVIHDPSGCNSTYNTHDEPRWYEQDSLVFISGLSEMDAIMGNDDKFIDDVVRAAKDLKPRFIALVRSPIPMMIGTDFDAVREIVEQETGIPTLYFPTNGMHSYVQGAGMALEAVARRMVEEMHQKTTAARKNIRPSVNLLGVTPLDFSINSTLASLLTFLERHGYEVISTFAMGSSLEDIARAGEADLNVVVSSVGLPAAKVLRERFGTPYVVGLPAAPFAEKMLADMERSLLDKICRISYKSCGDDIPDGIMNENQCKQSKTIIRETAETINRRTDEMLKTGQQSDREPEIPPVYLIGEAVISQSLAEAIRLRYGVPVCVLCPLETEGELLEWESSRCIPVESEEEIALLVKNGRGIVADPMYRPICPEHVPFFPLPHEAFSGRIYRRQIPDLTDIGFLDGWMYSLLERKEEHGTQF